MEEILPSAKSFSSFRLRRKILRVEVNQRLPFPSSRMRSNMLLGRPSFVVIAFKRPSRKRNNPPPYVASHRVPVESW